MSLKSDLAKDFIDNFLMDDEFAEDIIYSPKEDYERTIRAVVVRERVQPNEPDRHMSLNRECEIYIVNDAAKGITSINKNNDTVSFPVQIGGDSVDWTVVEIISHDDGVWHLRVTK